MKIVSWNCKVGFDKRKAEYINKYDADIYIIQECTKENIEQLNDFKKYSNWYGDDIDSKYGVGFFSDNFQCRLLSEHNKDYRYIVPYEISGDNKIFTLFSVWTKDTDKNNKKIEYTEHTWNAINYSFYQELLSKTVILVGDFNSNRNLDKQKKHTHNNIINKLKENKIESAYHKYFNIENGNEKDTTLFWRMDKNAKFHCDYCFVSPDFEIKNVKIEAIADWEKTKLSDHCPLIIELALNKTNLIKIKNIFEYEFKNWNITLPKENFDKREQGYIQQSGWLIQYCFGIEDGKEYMDYYSSHRMTDDNHVRLYDTGEKKGLSTFKIGHQVDPNDPEKTKLYKKEYFEYNRKVAQELIDKGFSRFTINMTLQTGMDKNN